MKQIVSIFLSLLLLIISIGDLLTFAHFISNRDLITNLFCINLDKPELQCKGKCHLVNTLNTEDETPNPATNELKTVKQFILPICQITWQSISNTLTNEINIYFENNLHPISYQNKVFHPPRQA